MNGQLSEILVATTYLAPATAEEIREIERFAGRALPEDYLNCLRNFNGAEGPVGREGYVAMWAAAEVPELNQGYRSSQFTPGLLLIGSDGGLTAIGIDCRANVPDEGAYIEMDFGLIGWRSVVYRTSSLYNVLLHFG